MADELIDIYDSDMNLLGTAMRFQAYHEGLWLKNVRCWIYDKGNIWFQKRSATKFLSPSLFDASCTEHPMAGENAKQAAVRGLEEKLGLEVNENELEKLFTCRTVDDVKGILVREFNPVYALKSRWKLSDVLMSSDEIDGVFAASLDELTNLFGGDVKTIEISGYCRGSNKPVRQNVSIKDFVPHSANYYLKVFAMLDRLID